MSKSEILTLEGIVTECLPNALFRVCLDNKHNVTATISGKIRKNNINILKDDRVDVEVTPYDLDKGRIVYRYR